MTYPSECTMNWLETIRLMSNKKMFLFILGAYILLNVIFTFFYHNFVPLSDGVQQSIQQPDITPPNSQTPASADVIHKSLLNSFYFSVVTGSTLGFGDLSPKNSFGKVVVIIHVMFSTALFALLISIAFLKMLYPRNTIILSKKLIYNQQTKSLSIRVINVNRAKLINPEIRMVMAEHTEEHGISHHRFIGKVNDLPCLGNHDMTFNFLDAGEMVRHEIQAARACDIPEDKDRFRIKVSISGTYGFSTYSHCRV